MPLARPPDIASLTAPQPLLLEKCGLALLFSLENQNRAKCQMNTMLRRLHLPRMVFKATSFPKVSLD